MKKIFIITLSALILTNTSIANDQKRQTEDSTIPFIVEGSYPIGSYSSGVRNSYSYRDSMSIEKQGESYISNVPTDAIKSITKEFKDNICKVNKGGEFEIALKLDASTKIIGVGASAEGGLKIRIVCDKNKP